MKLAPAPFSMIKSGQKTIELRLLDEKRQKIKVGDTIVFTNTETKDTLTVTVKKLHKFASFTELYSKLDLLQCGYTAETVKTASPEDMNQYYSLEKQEKYGVLGIEILIKP
ncbi:MAG: ASCH domain-containing protein [Clostridia bacterium]|nr:ASCH domain-containing protein [Clostridia bacterium]